jgi:YbbR domain-containing protein
MKRVLRKFVFKDWPLKVASFFIALTLWLFVHGDPDQERVIAVQLEVRKPQQMEIISQIPASVEITMRGASVSNAWFSQLPPTCVVDLQNASEGEHVVALTQNNIRMPQRGGGMEILRIAPARLTITLETTDSREVPIVAPVSAGPPPGFEVYNKYTLPSSVVITGAKSRLAPITEVETMPISLDEQREPSRFFASLNLHDSSIRVSEENLIQVQVAVGPVRRIHTINKIPVFVEGGDYSFTPEQVSVQILAPPEYIESVSAEDFRAVVRSGAFDAAKLPAQGKLTVQILKSSEGAAVIKAITPPEITIQQISTR